LLTDGCNEQKPKNNIVENKGMNPKALQKLLLNNFQARERERMTTMTT
jgi:hypothetical protein